MSNTDSQRLDAMRRQRDGYRNQLRKTEPTKEKTMSKTFKSAGNPCASISITPSAYGVGTVHAHGIEATGVTVSTADAPALALAILEAARVAESSDAGVAAQYLRAHMAEQERATAEAKEQAKLEAEAVKLANAGREASVAYERGSVLSLHELDAEFWLAVARKAREMSAEK